MTPLLSPAPLRLYLSEAAARLQQAGLTPRDASFDAEFLARAVLGWDRATVLAATPSTAVALAPERSARDNT